MPSKVILKVTKGELAGKEFIYESKEQLFIGRQEDCAIVLPDKSVSRYHCMLEITPPDVTVRDFGSLNGTFLNGKKIGQRERAVSAEDAQKEYHEEFELSDGDSLCLSKHCEISIHTVMAKRCGKCGEELPEAIVANTDGTILDDTPQGFVDDKGEAICEDCLLKQEAEKKEAELAAFEQERIKREKVEADQIEKARLEEIVKQQAAAQKKCSGCGINFTPKGPDHNICPKCAQDRNKILEAILMQAIGGIGQSPKDMGPANIKGFRKVKKIGAGAMGEVWLVREEKTGRHYAVKTMLPQVAADKHAKETFLREAMLGEALNNKNIIRVYKTGHHIKNP